MKENVIPIVFAFDNNFSIPVFVTISSLLYFANKDTRYKVYCIISDDVDDSNLIKIETLFTDSKHEILFVKANNDFDDAHVHRSITQASYFRLMLHDLLPHEDKIIYADVDVLFNGDLKNLYEIDMGKNLIGGVKNLYIFQVFDKLLSKYDYWKIYFSDLKYEYVNAGLLVMNLKEIRSTMIWKKWLEFSKYQWEFHDQDILNYTCRKKIHYLPPKYNMTYALRAKRANEYDLFESNLISEKPIVYHFTASKPWNSKHMNQSKVWWKYVEKHTDLYRYFLLKYSSEDNFNKKLKRFLKKTSRIPYSIYKKILKIQN